MRTLLLRLALAFPLAMVTASSAIAQTIPASQNKPPATFDQYPYRPACRQLTAAPGSADGWFAWGPTVEGKHQNWRGVEASVPPEQAYERLAAIGLCVLDGELVPLESSTDSAIAVTEDADLSPLQRRAAAARANAENQTGEGNVFLVASAIGGVLLWQFNKEMKSDDFPPMAAAPSKWNPLEALAPDNDAPIFAVPPAEAAPVKSEPINDGPVPQNPAILLAMRQRQTLITAKPRTGKSITVSLAWPKVQAEGVWVACLQPKFHRNEKQYWNGVDSICGFMLENWQMGEGDTVLVDGDRTAQLSKEQLAKQLTDYLIAWRKHPAKRKLLIIDELRALKEVLPDWYRDIFVPFLVVEMSSGETSGRIVWAITQSSLCGDIGFSGGDRSMFDLFVLETPESSEHYNSVRSSFKGLPAADKELYERSQSPKNAIFYHSVLGDWAPMIQFSTPQPIPELSGSAQLTDTHFVTSRTSAGSEPGSSGSAHYTRAEVISLLCGSGSGSATSEALVLALDEIKQGKSRTHIIEKTLGYSGRKFSEGAAIYERIKAFVEAQ